MNDLQLFLDGRCEPLVLKILAKVHVATKKQMCGFLTLANLNQTEEASNNCFNNLIKLGLLAVKRCRISSGLGKVRTRSGCPIVLTDIYFLNEAGVYTADNMYKGVGRFARGGEPEGFHEARIYHDLLITEAFLEACGTYDVTDFITEAELKSEIFHARGPHKTAENTGDFRIHYLRHDGARDSFTGEVILQSKKEQLLGKPRNTVFFCDCRQTADRIEEYKQTGAFILKNVLEEPKEVTIKTEQNFTTLEQKLVNLFDRFPIGMDAETAAMLLDNRRSKVSSSLFNLVRNGIFTYQFLQNNLGRPVKFYADKSIKNFDSLVVRKQFYSTCLLLKLVVKNNSIIESFNAENYYLILKHSSGKRMEIVIDNLQNSIEENIKNFTGLRNLNGSRVDGMKLAILDSNRSEKAENLLASKFLVKLTTN